VYAGCTREYTLGERYTLVYIPYYLPGWYTMVYIPYYLPGWYTWVYYASFYHTQGVLCLLLPYPEVYIPTMLPGTYPEMYIPTMLPGYRPKGVLCSPGYPGTVLRVYYALGLPGYRPTRFTVGGPFVRHRIYTFSPECRESGGYSPRVSLSSTTRFTVGR